VKRSAGSTAMRAGGQVLFRVAALLRPGLATSRLVHRILTGILIHWMVAHYATQAETRRKSMMFWKRALAIAALTLCCFASAGAAPPAGDGAPKHFLWKVTGPKGVVYLLGTIHAGKADFYPLPPIIEDSFKEADTLIEEIDISEPAEAARVQQGLIENGRYSNGDTITNHLSEVTRSHLAAYLRKGGLSEPAIAHMRPWLVSMLIDLYEMKQMGFDPSYGLDRHFLEEAQQSHKPIGALEDAGSQLKLLSSLSEEFQDRLLLSSLVDMEKSHDVVDLLTRAWQSGDAAAIQELVTSSVREYPQLKPLMTKLFDDRNTAMTAKIEHFLQTPKNYFIAVGVGHLVGDQGILSQLRRENFSVEQL
jgi:uncharacterized protein YbaP (TraB family)